MYRLIVSPRAKKHLRNIKKDLHREILTRAIEDLKEDPHLGKSLGREFTGKYSYRIGVYRIIYRIKEKEQIVEIMTAGHRSSIYQ